MLPLRSSDTYVDYFVTNNIAVSRSHADIVKTVTGKIQPAEITGMLIEGQKLIYNEKKHDIIRLTGTFEKTLLSLGGSTALTPFPIPFLRPWVLERLRMRFRFLSAKNLPDTTIGTGFCTVMTPHGRGQPL